MTNEEKEEIKNKLIDKVKDIDILDISMFKELGYELYNSMNIKDIAEIYESYCYMYSDFNLLKNFLKNQYISDKEKFIKSNNMDVKNYYKIKFLRYKKMLNTLNSLILYDELNTKLKLNQNISNVKIKI